MRATRGSGAPVRAGRARGAKREGSGRGVSRVGPGSPQCPSAPVHYLCCRRGRETRPCPRPVPAGKWLRGRAKVWRLGWLRAYFSLFPLVSGAGGRRKRSRAAPAGAERSGGGQPSGAAPGSRERGNGGTGRGNRPGKHRQTAQHWGGHRPVGADHHG